MYRFLYYNMGGVVMAAISGIDTALYDIVGKKLGVPVYKLLGGQVHEKLRVYANGWIEGIPRTPEAMAQKTKELVAKVTPVVSSIHSPDAVQPRSDSAGVAQRRGPGQSRARGGRG